MPVFVIEPIESVEESGVSSPVGAVALGSAAGVDWFKASVIPAAGRAPTRRELTVAHHELPAMRQLKSSVRRKIEAEQGCIYDLVADQAKQIEALTVLVSRMAADYLGGPVLSDEQRAIYLARVSAVIEGLDSGDLKLRGDAEDADDMLDRVLYRASRINEIVEDEYLPRRAWIMS